MNERRAKGAQEAAAAAAVVEGSGAGAGEGGGGEVRVGDEEAGATGSD